MVPKTRHLARKDVASQLGTVHQPRLSKLPSSPPWCFFLFSPFSWCFAFTTQLLSFFSAICQSHSFKSPVDPFILLQNYSAVLATRSVPVSYSISHLSLAKRIQFFQTRKHHEDCIFVSQLGRSACGPCSYRLHWYICRRSCSGTSFTGSSMSILLTSFRVMPLPCV